MTTYSAYATDPHLPSAPYSTSTDPLTVGLEVRCDTACWVTDLRWWQPAGGTTSSSARTVSLYRATGVSTGALLYSGSSSPGGATDAWIDHTMSAPVQLAAGSTYILTVWHPSGGWPMYTNWFEPGGPGASSLTVGPVTIPTSSASGFGGQGRYDFGTGPSDYPQDFYANAQFWLDFIVTDVDPGGGAPGVPLDTDATLSGATRPPALTGTARPPILAGADRPPTLTGRRP